MWLKQAYSKTQIHRNESVEKDDTKIEIMRKVANGEAIKGSAPIIYTEKADGVLPGYNIRTDRFEVARKLMEKTRKAGKIAAAKEYQPVEKEVENDVKNEEKNNQNS